MLVHTLMADQGEVAKIIRQQEFVRQLSSAYIGPVDLLSLLKLPEMFLQKYWMCV